MERKSLGRKCSQYLIRLETSVCGKDKVEKKKGAHL